MNQVKIEDKKLSSNPFSTYRDSKTGRWVVVKSETAAIKAEPILSKGQNHGII